MLQTKSLQEYTPSVRLMQHFFTKFYINNDHKIDAFLGTSVLNKSRIGKYNDSIKALITQTIRFAFTVHNYSIMSIGFYCATRIHTYFSGVAII